MAGDITPAYFVGIDQGTDCGYAVLDAAGARVTSGVWDLAMRRGEGAGFRYVRFVGYLRQLWSGLGLSDRNCVLAYEQSAPMQGVQGGNAAPVSNALVGHLQYQCEVKKIPYEGIHFATVKRFACGGRAKKVDMIDEANRRWRLNLAWEHAGIDPKTGRPRYRFPGASDNEADALWIAEACRRQLLG